MDFQAVVDSLPAMACVVSVEDLGDGKAGKYRIVTGNKAYIDSIEHPAPGTEMLTDRFTPNAEYTTYLTRDMNFEDYCYRAAVQKKCLHSYAHPDRMPVWFNMTFLPLTPDDGNICYCLYIMEINFTPDTKTMSDINGDMASAVLETCIKLRGAVDFEEAMKDVIKDIRKLCDAEYCCILTVDDSKRSCGVLCEAFSDDTDLLPMDKYVDEAFYDIVASWEETIAGSSCLIVKNEQDMEVVRERNPIWYESLYAAGAMSIVLFPLKSQDTLLGYIWAANFNAEDAVNIKETLELTTFILGSELGNSMLVDRLRELSSRDMLTGVMNRNEMNNYVDSLANSKDTGRASVAVIFADLNGLKNVNDVEGHAAGDQLLKDAASVLREVFDERSIFRAGGDEFAIIVKGYTEVTLNERIKSIRRGAERTGKVSFAIGGAVEYDYHNIRTALRHADLAMYEDKHRYYEEHPEMLRGIKRL